VQPSSGMAGGGQGDCQLPDGKTIEASFPRAS
jgi:putative hemolysin